MDSEILSVYTVQQLIDDCVVSCVCGGYNTLYHSIRYKY
jgi:hypothetical protein